MPYRLAMAPYSEQKYYTTMRCFCQCFLQNSFFFCYKVGSLSVYAVKYKKVKALTRCRFRGMGQKKNSKTLSCEGSIGLPLTRQTTRLLLRLAPKKQSLTRPRFARIGFVCPVICERKQKNTWPKPCAFVFWSGLRGSNPPPSPWQGDALPNELNPHIWCLRSESNQRHGDFQSPALPTELQRHQGSDGCKKVATRMGLEPTTSSVTG